MAYSWFRCEADIVDHPKTRAFCRDIKQPLGDAYILRGLCWLKRFAPRGTLSRSQGEALEVAARWPRAPGSLLAALERAGFLDRAPPERGASGVEAGSEAWTWHDWWAHQGALVEAADKSAERARKWRNERVRVESANSGRDGRDGRTNVTDERTVAGAAQEPADPPPTPPAPGRPSKPSKPSRAPADPRHAPLVATLTESYTDVTGDKYPFRPEDARHVTSLLALGEPAEVDERWRRALREPKYPKVRTLRELVSAWAHFPAQASLIGTGPIRVVHSGGW